MKKGMKKAFEVVMSVTGSHRNCERTVFVEANSKQDLIGANDVKRVFARPDINSEDCPCELIEKTIFSK